MFTALSLEDTQRLGLALGGLAEPGDLVMLNGPLGAGKTTLTQSIAKGLGVTSRVSSPTFVISQIHRGRIELVHVDAYRLSSMEELDSLDLDASLEDALTVVEWGAGKVEGLATSRLEIDITRRADDTRVFELRPFGERASELASALLAELDQ